MNSFNAFGQTNKEFGGNVPVWLGTVKPIPAGATFTAEKGKVYKAGTPVVYNPTTKTITIGTYETANGYLYNDIYSEEGGDATAAVIMYHAEGLLIERVVDGITEEQIAALQAKIPGVLLVRG
jgi:hypothetical protein